MFKKDSIVLKRKKWRFILPLAVILTIFSSCEKQSIKDDSDWVGLWTGNESGEIYFLDIQTDSEGSSYEVVGEDIIFGKPKIDETNNELSVGEKTFKIDAYPFLNETLNKSQAVLDSILFTRS